MEQSNLTQISQPLSVEDQITHHLNLMKEELAHESGPNFKNFWELRKALLLLFKETLPSSLRSKLWANYLMIAEEARMAKNHMEEGAKFAVEQLDLAISALEKENSSFHAGHLSAKLTTELPMPKTLEAKEESYRHLEQKIQLLYIFSSKVMQLREELIKLPMRMRLKAKYFDRLSLLGDQIFPLRKEYMNQVGENFLGDVDQFVSHHFSATTFDPEKMKRSLFFFREEIKKFQALGQQLSLLSASFATSRKQLSFCWDQLKGMEKEVKKEMADHKAASMTHAAQIREKISACKAKEGISLEELRSEIAAIQNYMRSVSLVRSDVVALKEEIALLARPLEEQEVREEEERKRKILEDEALQVKIFQEFLASLQKWKEELEGYEVAEAIAQLATYQQALQTLKVNKMQKQQLQQELKSVMERIEGLKEKKILSLSAHDKDALSALTLALNEQQEHRKEIKKQMEFYRKKKGSRALDFLQALELEDLLEVEKKRLEKVDQIIEEIKTKISEIN